MSQSHRTCLVIGIGFIGTPLVKALVAEGYKVRMIVRDTTERLRSVFDEQTWNQLETITGDYSDEMILDEALKGCDACVHLVSTTVPGTSNQDKQFDIQSNLVASVMLLEAARRHGVAKVIYMSSGGTVYGNPRYVPIDEDHPTNPISSYGITKLAIEKYFFLFRQLYGLQTVVLRLSNPYGPGQTKNGIQGAIPTFLERAHSDQAIEVWGDGSVVRDYIHIDDTLSSVLAALNYSGEETVFNIGSGVGTDLNEIISLIETSLGRPVAVSYRPGRSIDVRENVLDISKAQKHLGWRPRITLAEGVAQLAGDNTYNKQINRLGGQ